VVVPRSYVIQMHLTSKPIARVTFELRRIVGQARQFRILRRIGGSWIPSATTERRRYPDYKTYVAHQKEKLNAMRGRTLVKHDERFYSALRARLDALPFSVRGCRVLCLAARQGTEVRAFIDAGAFAIGIDLNPGRSNSYVVTGDFHSLQFASGSVDIVYTNSIDHAFDLERIMAEALRVLSSDGVLMLEVGTGFESGHGPGMYESFAWTDADTLLARIVESGLVLQERCDFEIPWPGIQFVLRPGALPHSFPGRSGGAIGNGNSPLLE
jgi:SAM-dependent methyltransferase